MAHWREAGRAALVAAMALWAGCGDGSADDVPPRVVSNTPAADAASVAITSGVVVVFSEPMDPSTVTTASITVSDGRSFVAGSVVYQATAQMAAFSPDELFRPDTEYRVEVTTAVKDSAGNPMLEAHRFRFRTVKVTEIAGPTLASADPADGAVNVDPRGPFTLVLSEPVAPTSVTAESVLLTDRGVAVAASRVVTGATVVVTPARPLALATAHELRMTADVIDTGGIRATAATVRFTTRDGAFGVADPVASGTVAARRARVAISATGRAVAVWEQPSGGPVDIWSNVYEPGRGWGTSQSLETAIGDALAPEIVMDDSGRALAVWQQNDALGVPSVFAARMTAAAGAWADPIALETAGFAATAPRIAMTAAGDAIALWEQTDGTRTSIWSARFTAATSTWAAAVLVESDDVGAARSPDVALDGQGTALATWLQADAMRDNVMASRSSLAAGWGTAQKIEALNTVPQAPRVAINAGGAGFIVWSQSDGFRDNVWGVRAPAAGGFQPARTIESDNMGHARRPRVAVDGDGTAHIAWDQEEATRRNVWATRMTQATLAPAMLLETSSADDPTSAVIAVTPAGHALVVWQQSAAGVPSIWANRALPGAAFGPARVIATNPLRVARAVDLAVSQSGVAVAIWEEDAAGTTRIWASRFD